MNNYNKNKFQEIAHNKFNEIKNLKTQQQSLVDKNEINIDYMNSLEDQETKREYLGELIFKKIENHPLAQKYEFNINKIGKTTGMILEIQDINAITEICRNEDNLGSYIKEAYELLKDSGN